MKENKNYQGQQRNIVRKHHEALDSGFCQRRRSEQGYVLKGGERERGKEGEKERRREG
jgi:hypothetical protein